MNVLSPLLGLVPDSNRVTFSDLQSTLVVLNTVGEVAFKFAIDDKEHGERLPTEGPEDLARKPRFTEVWGAIVAGGAVYGIDNVLGHGGQPGLSFGPGFGV